MTPRSTTIMAGLRRWVLSAVLLAAAGTSGWMLYDFSLDERVTTRAAPVAPDAYMEKFVTVEMDGTGKPRRRIEADYIAYHADDTVELTNPHYVLHHAQGEPWHVRSERGKVSEDGAVVWLLGKVDVWRDDASGDRDLHIRTEYLKVLPDSEYGETAKPVTIRTPTSVSTGVGMRAYLDQTRFQLLSQVRTNVDGRSRRR